LSGEDHALDKIALKVLRNPFLAYSIFKKIHSSKAVCQLLERELESEFKTLKDCRRVLKRLEKKIGELRGFDERLVEYVWNSSSLELKSDLTVVSVGLDSYMDVLKLIAELRGRARFLSVVQSASAITVIIDREHTNQVLEALGHRVLYHKVGVSAIIMVSPDEVITTPGFVAVITSLLSMNGVNILQLLSCHRDTIIILSEEDSRKAFQLLSSLSKQG